MKAIIWIFPKTYLKQCLEMLISTCSFKRKTVMISYIEYRNSMAEYAHKLKLI